jgi:glycosyltransferase involved in cell wall biosynthesis
MTEVLVAASSLDGGSVAGSTARHRAFVEELSARFGDVAVWNPASGWRYRQAEPGIAGKLALARRLVVSRYPSRCVWPVPIPKAAHDADLLVTMMPALAHLGLQERTGRWLCVLEETWERDYASGPFVARLQARRDLPRYRRLWRAIGQRADSVVVISPLERDHFSQFIPEHKLHVVPHAIAIDDFPVAPPGRRGHDVIIAGLRFPNVPSLIQQADTYARHRLGRELRWLIAGGPPPPEVAALKSERITVTGRVREIGPFYNDALIALVPPEGGGVKTTLLQAWSCGLAAVATEEAMQAAGAPALVASPAATTDQDLVASLVELIADEARRTAIGAAARAHVEAHHDARLNARQFADLAVRLTI